MQISSGGWSNTDYFNWKWSVEEVYVVHAVQVFQMVQLVQVVRIVLTLPISA